MRKILFHHIPKTAGTALIVHATHAFGARVCPARYDSDISAEMIQDASYTFYHGHFSRHVVCAFRLLCPDAFIFTFVRHPFTRVLSQYYNWTDRAKVGRELSLMAERVPDAAHVQALRRKFADLIFDLSLDEFLTSTDPDVGQVVNNLQSQYLTAFELPAHVRFNKAALNLITTYDFVGLQELYEPCLRVVEAQCGMTTGLLGGSERINGSKHVRPSGSYRVSRRQLSLLESCSVYDMAIFHLGHALLLKQHGGLLPSAALDIDTLVELPVVDDGIDDRLPLFRDEPRVI